MYRLLHLGPSDSATDLLPLPGVTISRLCRNGIRVLLLGMTGPQMRFPSPLSLQGDSVKTPGANSPGKRPGREGATGWAELGKLTKRKHLPAPSDPPLPTPSPSPSRCNARCNLASKHRITANQGEKAPKEELISASSCKSFGQSLKVQSRTNSAPCANSKLKAFRKEEGARRRAIEWIYFSKNQH